MSLPLLSVCLITYNHKDYISQAIEGVLMQKVSFPFELIIADDFSTDGTRDILKEYETKYPDFIKLILQEKNIGPANNWINLITAPNEKVKYVAYFEGDDYWTDPLKLQKQVDFLEANPDHNICFHRANLLQRGELNLHDIPSEFENNSFYYIELLKHFNFITTASVVFRNFEKDDLPNWFLDIPFGDLALYKIVAKNKKIHCLPEIMSVYRIHDTGIWSGLNQIEVKYKYLNFYKIIYKDLNYEEKVVVKKKVYKLKYEIANIKFPKSRVLSKIYLTYLSLKF